MVASPGHEFTQMFNRLARVSEVLEALDLTVSQHMHVLLPHVEADLNTNNNFDIFFLYC